MFILFLGIILGGSLGYIAAHMQMHIVDMIADRDKQIHLLKEELKKVSNG